jgi:hypothetical protein
MKHIRAKMVASTRLFLAVLLLAALFLAASRTLAQSGSGYDLSWSTLDSGGGQSSGGDYTLAGTIGQPDAGALAGGGYTLTGGFWGGAAAQYRIYLPLVLRGM